MKLEIARPVYLDMVRASRKALPVEACGLLAGSDFRVSRNYLLTNADASAEHFRMIPEEQFSAVRDMRGRGLGMLAIWHSHPSTPARMSDEDLRLAFTPGIAHVILSLSLPDEPSIRGYRVIDGVPKEIEINVV